MLKAKLAPVLGTRFDIDRHAPPALRAPLHELERVRGASLQWLPESALLVVETPGRRQRTFSLLRNTAHASVSHLLGERSELRPDEDTLTVVPGVIGSYPNAFYRVPAGRAAGPDRGDPPASLRSRLRSLREALGGAAHQPGLLGLQRRAGRPLSQGPAAAKRASSTTTASRTARAAAGSP